MIAYLNNSITQIAVQPNTIRWYSIGYQTIYWNMLIKIWQKEVI